MPEPITAAVLGKIIIASAAQQLGTRVGDAIAEGIFGKSNDHKEIKNLLQELNRKTDEILYFSRASYAMLERLPDVVQGMLDGQTLYLAHTEIKSNLQAYMQLPQWHNTIGHDTFASILRGWNVIIDMESSLDRLLEIPQYGEFLLLATNGQLYDAVSGGAKLKLDMVASALDSLVRDQIDPAAAEARRLIDSPHVKLGDILDGNPWVAWSMHSQRTKTYKECFDRPCSACNGSITTCYDKQVPDTAWNTQLQRTNDQLKSISEKIDTLTKQLHAYVVVKDVLSVFVQSLEDRKNALHSFPHVKVLESREPFPAPKAD